VLTASEFAWDTSAVPDGYYRIRVSASDELDNPRPLALETRDESEPFLVDNRPPELLEMRADAQRITGVARDAQGPISRLEYAVDGLEWRLARADDDLVDTREERFSIPLRDLPRVTLDRGTRQRRARQQHDAGSRSAGAVGTAAPCRGARTWTARQIAHSAATARARAD